MRICGIEIKNHEIFISLLNGDDGLFDVPPCRARRMAVKGVDSTDELRHFASTFQKLVEDYKIDKVVIRERAKKGKFAGSAISFKLEAALQVAAGVDVIILSPSFIKQSLKNTPLLIDFKATEQKPFQEQAFLVAYAYFNLDNIPAPESDTDKDIDKDADSGSQESVWPKI